MDNYPPRRYPVTPEQKQRRKDENWKALRIMALVLLFTPIGNVLFYVIAGHWPGG